MQDQDVSYHNGATPQPIQPGRQRFAIVPSRIIFDNRLSERAVRILFAIASHANTDRVCIVEQSTIAKRLGYRREAVSRSVAQLVLCGYLDVYHLGAEGRRGRGANGYMLLFDQWGNPTPPPDDGTRINVRPTSHKSPERTIYVRREAHNSDDLCASEDTQIFMCAEEHLTPPDLCASGRTALTEYREERTESYDCSESASVSVSEEEREQKGYADARARAPEDLATDLRASLDPQKHERRELWQRIIGVLNVPKSQRQEWLDPCTLYEVTEHNFLLVAPTLGQKYFVDVHWGVAIWCELQKMLRAECELTLDYGAPAPPQRERAHAS